MANVGTHEQWLERRMALLAEEKEHTRRADELARKRRELPWVRIEDDYHFATADGQKHLTELFDGRSQLAMYHFMYGDGWGEGCPSCSFWADSFDGVGVHLAQRDLTFLVCSVAPLDQLLAYRERMGWSFPWVSSAGTRFNHDFGVSGGMSYNYHLTDEPIPESPGLSVFALEDGVAYHTYSTFARGLESFNAAYQLLDLVPKGRDEPIRHSTMEWIHRHDDYAD